MNNEKSKKTPEENAKVPNLSGNIYDPKKTFGQPTKTLKYYIDDTGVLVRDLAYKHRFVTLLL